MSYGSKDGQDKAVQIGCGSLVLIALIVMIFSKGGDYSGPSRSEFRETAEAVTRLERKIDTLTTLVRKQQQEIERLRAERAVDGGRRDTAAR